MHLIKKLKYNRVLQISSRLYSEFSNNMQSCLTRYQKQSRSNILPSSYPKKKKKVFASWGSLSAQESVLQNSSVVERHLGFKKTATVQEESLRAEDEKNFPLFLAPCVLCCKCFFFSGRVLCGEGKKNSWGYFSPFISTEESDLSLFTNPVSSSALTSSVGAAASRFLSSSSFTFRFAVTPRGGLTSVVVESGAERSQTVGPSHFGISSPSNSISCFMTSST